MDILLKFAIHAKNLSERPGVAASERRKVQEAIFKFEPEQKYRMPQRWAPNQIK
jgi:hypothetical protein